MRWQSGLGIAFIAVLSNAPVAARAQADDPYLRTIQVLRKAVLDQERLNSLATNPPPAQVPAFEVLEKQFLEGKLSARQFQQFVLDFKLSRTAAPAAPPPPATNRPPPTPPTPPAPAAAPPATAVTAAAAPAGTNASEPQNPSMDRLAEMEAQMDRIIQEKAARDRALTNQPAPAPAVAKTKRERLNELLRELIAGKITEEQYKAKWAQITAAKE